MKPGRWIVLTLAACCLASCGLGPTTESGLPDTGGVGGGTTIPANVGDRIGGTVEFLDALVSTGAQVEHRGEVLQPFVEIPGSRVSVDGHEVQVFEFGSEAQRANVSGSISADGSLVGEHLPEWTDVPHFWSRGRILVLYSGQNQALIHRLDRVLGMEITTLNAAGPSLPPELITMVKGFLGAALDLSPGSIQVASYEPASWLDGCLDLPEDNEQCPAGPVSGWKVWLKAGGRQYEVHTDAAGNEIRLR